MQCITALRMVSHACELYSTAVGIQNGYRNDSINKKTLFIPFTFNFLRVFARVKKKKTAHRKGTENANVIFTGLRSRQKRRYTVYVVDSEGRLVDDVRLRRLILADPGRRVADVMDWITSSLQFWSRTTGRRRSHSCGATPCSCCRWWIATESSSASSRPTMCSTSRKLKGQPGHPGFDKSR